MDAQDTHVHNRLHLQDEEFYPYRLACLSKIDVN